MSNYNYKSRSKKEEKTIFEIIIVGFFKLLWWLILLPFKNREKELSVYARKEIVYKKGHLEQTLQSDNVFELKQGVFEADKLVDFILKEKGFSGNTFAERLKNAREKINHSQYDKIWHGHKVRNQLAHEHDASFDQSELKMAINNLMDYIRNV